MDAVAYSANGVPERRTGAWPEPLVWKQESFRVRVAVDPCSKEVHEIEVQGPVSGLFGIFRGDSRGPSSDGRHVFPLIHLPTARILSTLRLRRQCVAMATEFALLSVPWHETDPEKVVEGAPDQVKVQEICRRYARDVTQR